MDYNKIKRLVNRTAVPRWLERVGLRESVGDLARFLMDPAERERRLIVDEDYWSCERQFRRIARGSASGDPMKIAWMISSMQTVWGLKLEGILSLAARLRNFLPVAVHLGRSALSRRYHGLFGIDRFINFQECLVGTQVPAAAPEIVELIHSGPTVGDLLKLTYRQVDIGRIALSNMIYRNKFAKFDVTEPAVLAELHMELLRVQRNVLAAEEMLAGSRPAVALLLEKGISPMAEIFGVCITKNVPVVQYSGSQDDNAYILRRLSCQNRHQHPFSLDESTWDYVKNMPWSRSNELQLMEGISDSYKSGTWFNRRFLGEDREIKSAERVREQLGLDPSKKTAVIFSHVLWDATFFYGTSLFDDYETWLVETVRAACNNPSVNWIVKLHPDLTWKLKYEDYIGELRDNSVIRDAVGSLPDHVKIVFPGTDISTYSFFEITDYCLTVRGTIGIEMACFGVPVLTAGTGRYSGLGFTIDSASAEEYLRRLSRIETTPPMAREQRSLARRFAYALFMLRPWRAKSFEMVKMPAERAGHPLDTNIIPRINTFEEFSRASDMCEFADWLASDEVDYLCADTESA